MPFRPSPRVYGLTLLWALSVCARAESDPLDEVEKSSEAWLQTRLEANRLESNWATEHALLESTLAGLQERAAAEEEKRDLAKAKSARDREELETLRSRAKATREDLQQLETRLKTVQTRLVQLRPTLPPRLSGGLEMAFRTLERADLSPSERMQAVMTIVNRCVQFNRAITYGEEIVTIDAASRPRALPVIYWGLSHAYALDRDHQQAWLGRPGVGGWSWEPRPAARENIAKLLAIYTDKADPAFVITPATASSTLGQPEHR